MKYFPDIASTERKICCSCKYSIISREHMFSGIKSLNFSIFNIITYRFIIKISFTCYYTGRQESEKHLYSSFCQILKALAHV